MLLILMDKISNNMLSNFKPFSSSLAFFTSLEELQGERNCLTLKFVLIVIVLYTECRYGGPLGRRPARVA